MPHAEEDPVTYGNFLSSLLICQPQNTKKQSVCLLPVASLFPAAAVAGPSSIPFGRK
jgi:hypothetical protein